jgi:hypothetical protein
VNSPLVLLPDRDNLADFGILDQRKSARRYSCEGSEEGARCTGVEYVPCRIREVIGSIQRSTFGA